MHSFLKAIGFSNINNRIELEKLLKKVIDEATHKKLMEIDDTVTIAELSLEVSEGIGVTIRGEYDQNNEFHIGHYFPYLKGQNVSTREEIYVSKRVDTDAYTGMCDDYRLGVSLIFYIQNAIDYLNYEKAPRGPRIHSVTLAGLSCEGKILLPASIEQTENKTGLDVHQKSHLLAEAKKGNPEAIDSLTINDIDLYTIVSKRIQEEDIYSIVGTSFIPFGSESDNYTIIGNIINVNKQKNRLTNEILYVLTVESNNLTFEVCINEENLFGEPAPGRRFKGNLWMQGEIDFY